MKTMRSFFQTRNKMKSNDTYLLFETIEVQRKNTSSTVQIKSAVRECMQKGRIVGIVIVLIPGKKQPGSLAREAATRRRHNIKK